MVLRTTREDHKTRNIQCKNQRGAKMKNDVFLNDMKDKCKKKKAKMPLGLDSSHPLKACSALSNKLLNSAIMRTAAEPEVGTFQHP